MMCNVSSISSGDNHFRRLSPVTTCSLRFQDAPLRWMWCCRASSTLPWPGSRCAVKIGNPLQIGDFRVLTCPDYFSRYLKVTKILKMGQLVEVLTSLVIVLTSLGLLALMPVAREIFSGNCPFESEPIRPSLLHSSWNLVKIQKTRLTPSIWKGGRRETRWYTSFCSRFQILGSKTWVLDGSWNLRISWFLPTPIKEGNVFGADPFQIPPDHVNVPNLYPIYSSLISLSYRTIGRHRMIGRPMIISTEVVSCKNALCWPRWIWRGIATCARRLDFVHCSKVGQVSVGTTHQKWVWTPGDGPPIEGNLNDQPCFFLEFSHVFPSILETQLIVVMARDGLKTSESQPFSRVFDHLARIDFERFSTAAESLKTVETMRSKNPQVWSLIFKYTSVSVEIFPWLDHPFHGEIPIENGGSHGESHRQVIGSLWSNWSWRIADWRLPLRMSWAKS